MSRLLRVRLQIKDRQLAQERTEFVLDVRV